MLDVYAVITEVDDAIVDQVARVLEQNAADPQLRAMIDLYLADLDMRKDSRVLEIGCGTGVISRVLARWPGVAGVLGLDPSPGLVARARELSEGFPNLTFQVADGRAVPIVDGAFDVVVLHRVLSHVPGPDRVLAEAFRLLCPGGRLAVFDGDYSTVTVAVGAGDPLQACVSAFQEGYVHDPWIVRRLSRLTVHAGFVGQQVRSHGYVQIEEPEYLLSIVDRGADALRASGMIRAPLADALKAEARVRVDENAFFGHVAYASLTAGRPG